MTRKRAQKDRFSDQSFDCSMEKPKPYTKPHFKRRLLWAPGVCQTYSPGLATGLNIVWRGGGGGRQLVRKMKRLFRELWRALLYLFDESKQRRIQATIGGVFLPNGSRIYRRTHKYLGVSHPCTQSPPPTKSVRESKGKRIPSVHIKTDSNWLALMVRVMEGDGVCSVVLKLPS